MKLWTNDMFQIVVINLKDFSLAGRKWVSVTYLKNTTKSLLLFSKEQKNLIYQCEPF